MKNNVLSNPSLHIVLDRPRIAGNIAATIRTCVATNCALHVCGPLVFETNDKSKWRAGLDYFFGSRIHFHQSLERCLTLLEKTPWLIEVGGQNTPWEVSLSRGDVAVLGPENGSIKEEVMKKYNDRRLTLPQLGPVRSINLAQVAAVISYEALRQQTHVK